MHAVDFLSEIEKGIFRTELLSLKINSGAGETFGGQGFLSWTQKRGIRIQALTDGQALLAERTRRFFQGGVSATLGQLVPDREYAELEAETRDGHRMKIDRLETHCCDVYSTNPTVVWRIGQKMCSVQLRW